MLSIDKPVPVAGQPAIVDCAKSTLVRLSKPNTLQVSKLLSATQLADTVPPPSR